MTDHIDEMIIRLQELEDAIYAAEAAGESTASLRAEADRLDNEIEDERQEEFDDDDFDEDDEEI